MSYFYKGTDVYSPILYGLTTIQLVNYYVSNRKRVVCILLPSRQDEPIWLLGIARFFQQYNKSFNSPACSVNMVGGVHSFRYKVSLCIVNSIRALVVKSFCCITKLKTTPTFAGVHTDMMPRNDFAANRLHFAEKRLVMKRLCSETTGKLVGH